MQFSAATRRNKSVPINRNDDAYQGRAKARYYLPTVAVFIKNSLDTNEKENGRQSDPKHGKPYGRKQLVWYSGLSHLQ